MSDTCKWENYCNTQRTRAKSSCLSLRAQIRAFEEEMLAVQWTARQEQIRVEYELCVGACECTQCSCETECINTRNTIFSFFQTQYNTDLAAIAEKYTCCDEQYCTQEGDTEYQICCDTNGPIGTAGRPDTATYAGVSTPTPDFGDRSAPPVANFVDQTQNPEDKLIVYKEIEIRPVNCANVLIATSRTCQNEAWNTWFTEQQRIKAKFEADKLKCLADLYACKDSKKTCDNIHLACLDNAKTEAETKTQINDTQYEEKTGETTGGASIPGAKQSPWVRPPCRCCRKTHNAYMACKFREALRKLDAKNSNVGYPY